MLHPKAPIHRTIRWLGITLAAASLAAFAATAAARPADGPCQAEKQLNVAAKMRDGVTLYADVYRPKLAGSYPVILMRLPYNKDAAQTYVYAPPEFYASHCYIVVIQDVRGANTPPRARSMPSATRPRTATTPSNGRRSCPVPTARSACTASPMSEPRSGCRRR